MTEYGKVAEMWQRAAEETRLFSHELLRRPQPQHLHHWPGQEEEETGAGAAGLGDSSESAALVNTFRTLQGAAAQLQGLGYEAGIWDLMGTVLIARRALDALTAIIASLPSGAEGEIGAVPGVGQGGRDRDAEVGMAGRAMTVHG